MTTTAMAPAPAPARTAASPTPTPIPSKNQPTPTEPPQAEPETSAYRSAERRYRVRRVPLNAKQTRFARQDPDLGGVLDFTCPATVDADPRVRRVGPEEADMRGLGALGGHGSGDEEEEEIRVYALRDRPGFYVIANALGERAQARWARMCLARFSRSRHTNLTNLQRQVSSSSSSPSFSASSLWVNGVRELQQQQQQQQSPSPRHDDDNDALDAALKPLRALRWANVGQNYDWGSRTYGGVDVTRRQKRMTSDSADTAAAAEEEEGGGAAASAFHRIPPALSALVRAAAEPLGFSCAAEAGIVNFYPADASMGGHVDDAEGALLHPVVSFSLGLAAVFLLGGATKDDAARPPIPLLVRSGDCLVMGGGSRLCVHGVPAILLDAARPPRLLTDAGALMASRFWEGGDEDEEGEGGEPCSEAEAALITRYLARNRINFNVRQVFVDEEEEEEEEEGACCW